MTVLLTQYFSDDEIKKMRQAGLVARLEGRRVAHRVLEWRPDGKTPLGRPRQ